MAPREELPPPRDRGSLSVEEAIRRRRSCRSFRREPVSADAVSQICWAAQGVTEPREGLRAAPSAGGILPVTILVASEEGVFAYEPAGHALQRVIDRDVRRDLQAAALDQSCVGEAPLCMVITADIGRMARKYGDRAGRYCDMEAGHIAQNALLQAEALGLAGVPVGAFEEAEVATILELPPRLTPLYMLPIGAPA